MVKRIFFIILMAVLLTACAAPAAPTAESDKPDTGDKLVIGMMVVTSHPSLDAIRQGVKDQLAAAGYVEGDSFEIIEGNAEGDIPTLATIAQQFVDEGVDLIVATSTPALQAAYNATKDAGGPPVFFNGISNPYAAGVATAPNDHPAWLIGNQLQDPVKEALGLIAEIEPESKVVGMIYNPAEANAVYLVELAQKEVAAFGMTLELATVNNTAEVQAAAEALVARPVDAFLAVGDNTVASAFEAVVQVANDNDILLIGTSASFPPRGAAASFGVDPYQEGLDSGEMVVKYLAGELDIATAEIQIQDAVLLTVNPAAAVEQGAEIPAALKERADKVIE